MFWRVEAKTGLYIFFKMVCDEYNIIDNENYTISAEAEGLEPETPQARQQLMPDVPTLHKRDPDEQQEQPIGNNVLAIGDTTKRHRHTPSDLTSSASNVIQEEAEEEDEEQLAKEQQLPENPTLNRQATALKEWPEESDVTTPAVEKEEPVLGVARSDTMKPPKEESDEAENVDVTVVETEVKEEEEEAAPTSTEVKVEEVEVKQEAADPEEAGKTVGD